MKWYFHVMRNYAVFSGRARRKEYWSFFGWNLLVAVAIGILAGLAQAGPDATNLIANLYQLAVLVPSIAVGVRRMHDTGHSGWWLIVPFMNLIFVFRDGDAGANEYGLDPKEGASVTSGPGVLSPIAH